MMITQKTYELLDQIEEIPKGNGSRKLKEEILKANRSDLNEIFSIALDPYRVFGIASLPSTVNKLYKQYVSLEELVAQLEAKKGVQNNETKQYTRDIIDQQRVLHPSAHKWAELAILKNFTLGLEAKTLNKYGYNIPVFECLLSDPNPKNELPGTTYPCYSQVKFDGVRMIRFPKNILLGRNGKPPQNTNVNQHFNVGSLFENYVLDGEFFSFVKNFNQIISVFKEEGAEISDDIKYVVFGAMLKETWDSQGKSMEYDEQLDLIDAICTSSKNLVSVRQYTKLCKDEAEVRATYAEHIAQGFEGSMVRNKNSRYSWERVSPKDGIITKLKPSDKADCIIKGMYEGENQYSGTFGGFYLDYKGVEVKCGGGFKTHERNEIWANPNKYIGQTCRVKYTEITPEGSLRFPIWDSIRDAK